GAKVVVADMNLKGAETTVKEIKTQGGDAFAIQIDITSPEQWQDLVIKTLETYGKINSLANCAGIAGNFSVGQEGTPIEEFDLLVNVNLNGPYLGIKYTVAEMRKAGLRSLGKNCAIDYAKDNIRINTVFPGQIKTPMSASLETPEAVEIKKFYIDKIPMGHFGESKDVAYALLYLASDKAAFITGAELVIDGGTTAH
ncbi:MAG: SDR family oxidoreductase, partial [Clostridiales bacterium]|nr:SDR family oxidoreductase [Clostridiales bacterium]